MHITAEDVVKSIRDLKPGDEYGCPSQCTVTQYIKSLKQREKRLLEYCKEHRQKADAHKDDESGWEFDYHHRRANEWMDDYMEVSAQIDHVKALKSKGFKYVTEIGFGDNHGSVQGEGVGDIMDYAGRSIDIDKEDFVVWTEQNR
jgi:hypothetical protein